MNPGLENNDSNQMSNGDIALLLTEYHLVHRNLFKSLIKSSTMPLTQYHILDMLNNNQNIRMGEISQLMAISRPNLTPLIDKLVSLQYVERIPDSHDRRVTYINITDSGRQSLESERAAIESNIQLFASRLSKEDYDDFCHSMEILVRLSKKM